MLVLSRRPGELVEIGNDIRVKVTEIAGSRVRLGIEAPRHISICRPEAKQKTANSVSAEPKALRILVVDDSPEDRETYCRFMKADRDHEYLFAETATVYLGRPDPALVICRTFHCTVDGQTEAVARKFALCQII